MSIPPRRMRSASPAYGQSGADQPRLCDQHGYGGGGRGDRVAILSKNRPNYTIVQIACRRLGAIVACQNWRLAPVELRSSARKWSG